MHTARIEDVEYEEGDEDDPESQMRKNSDPVMTIVPTLKMTIAPTLRMTIRFTLHTNSVLLSIASFSNGILHCGQNI